LVDQCGAQAEIRCMEGGGVATWARADDRHIIVVCLVHLVCFVFLVFVFLIRF
jgi:hypothetical protein